MNVTLACPPLLQPPTHTNAPHPKTVNVVMNELRVRAEEKQRRKISRQKRTEEIFASVA